MNGIRIHSNGKSRLSDDLYIKACCEDCGEQYTIVTKIPKGSIIYECQKCGKENKATWDIRK